jgi:ATP-dependent DNA ligase
VVAQRASRRPLVRSALTGIGNPPSGPRRHPRRNPDHIAAYSRPGRSLLVHAGLACLRNVQWPLAQAVLDGEICEDTGSDGVQSALEARGRHDAVTSFLAFDVLAVDGREVMREPWVDRRKRLEDIGAARDSQRIAIVPVSDDADRLWSLWVGQQGGEGIVLKERRAAYRPVYGRQHGSR